MRTQVGIVGAGPAGLMLSHLLHLAGIASIIIENRSREYCEARVRAGLIEGWASKMMMETGLGERMKRESMVHNGIYLCFGGELHHIDFQKLVGKRVTIYGQQEVVKDLIAKRLADGGQILFEVEDVSVARHRRPSRRKIRFQHQGRAQEIDCDFIGGCDGFHGVCRPSIPAGALTEYDREYPFAWLGILARTAPVADELIYAYHPRGFALFSMRGPQLVRYYLQCEPDEDSEQWPDERIWDELETRLGGTQEARARADDREGRGADALVRGRADAARPAVPRGRRRPHRAADRRQGHEPARSPTCACCRARSREFYRSGATAALENYSQVGAAAGVEGAALLLVDDAAVPPVSGARSPFDRKRQLAELDYLAGSEVAKTSLAENYVGLPVE